jgi:uncharacterized protein (UPF0332 family)
VRPGSATLLAKAERAAHVAAAALAQGAAALAAGRAFYAMLYAAKVVLNERGLRLRTHDRIVAALARVGGEPAADLAGWLAEALARRRASDAADVTYEDAAALCARAERALGIARRQLEPPAP